MDTSHMWLTEARKRLHVWRAILLPLGALILSLLVLGAWFTSLASAAGRPAPLAQGGAFDLQIVKAQAPTAFTVGSNNQYIITVSRTNTEIITVPPFIEDALPTGMTVVNITAAGWDCTTSSSTRVSCIYLQSIPSTLVDFPVIAVDVTVAPTIDPVVINTVQLYPGISNPDLNPDNNTNTIITTIDSVDLEISKTANPHSTGVNSPITYTILIANHGPAEAVNVQVTDIWPSSYLTYTGCSPAGYNVSTGVWNLAHPLAINESIVLTLWGVTKQTSDHQPITNPIVNTATVSSDNSSDWDGSNNSDSDTIVVGGPEIVKTVSASTSHVGETFDYTIDVYNDTDQPIDNAVIRDVFTTTLDIVSCTVYPAATPCNLSGWILDQYVTLPAAVGSIPGHVWIEIKVMPNATLDDAMFIRNTASIQWNSPDVNIYSNTVSTYVLPTGLLRIEKRDNVIITIKPNQVFTYTVIITNTGALPVSNLRVTETIPTKISALSVNQARMEALGFTGGCNVDKWICVWRRSSCMNPGQVISFKMRAWVASTAKGNIVNRIAVSGLDTGDGHRIFANDTEVTKMLKAFFLPFIWNQLFSVASSM